jgi:hypothetical protein
MSTDTKIVFNYSLHNDSWDWDDVVAGTVTLKLATVLDEGDAFHFKDHPYGFGKVVEVVGDGSTTLEDLSPTGGGSIFIDEVLSGQRVIKWDTGFMLISGNDLALSTGVKTVTYSVAFVGSPVILASADDAANAIFASANTVATLFNTSVWFTNNTRAAATYNWLAIGRWK